MEIIPFLKINTEYYILITDEVKECKKLNPSFFFNKSILIDLKEKETVIKGVVNEILKGVNIRVTSDYNIYKDPKTIVLYRKKRKLESIFKKKQDYEYYLGLQKINTFRIQNKSFLFENLFNEKKIHIGSYLNILMNYFFCDEYTFWLYNGITHIMTREASSYSKDQIHINRTNDTSLFDFVDSGLMYEIRKPNRKYAEKFGLDKMKTLNRIYVPLENKDFYGILNFYSTLENFSLKDKAIKFLQSYIKTRIIENRESMHLALESFEDRLSSGYDLTNYQPFLDDIVEKISNEFKFETCSVFIIKDNMLELISSHNPEFSGKPRFPIRYSLDGEGLSIRTIREEGLVYSYDLQNDKRNSHFYDEPKKLPPTNWIGIPLKWNDQVRGILRVSNKYYLDGQERKIRSLRYEDFIFLKAACSSVSSVLRIIELIQKHVSEINNLENKTDELENFGRVFLHEIRTPISKFSLSLISIKKILRKGSVDANTLSIVEKRLDDITVLGDRLAFITNVYYYEQMVQPVKIEKINVLSEIVFPIINITREYVRTKWKVDIIHDGISLRGHYVLGDKRLLNIVLNTLVDNAAKYSTEEKKPIEIYGKSDILNNVFKIYVSNYGFPIYDDEVDEIFKDRKRGRYVTSNRLEGTVIGLDLAKKIMKNSNGDLKLISNKNPITFEITIPSI